MKKNSIIKAIAITFGIYAILSWIIPGGSFASGEFAKGSTSPVGIGELFSYPIQTFVTSVCALVGVCVLLIGALYGVMNKTGAYQKYVEGVVKKFEGKEKSFLVISILTFAVLASLTTLTIPLLVLVPFFVTVILLLGYNKMTALLSTVGALLVGNMATIFGFNVEGYNFLNLFFQLKTTDNIIFRLILFVVLTAILVVYVVKTSKLSKTKKVVKKSTKKEEKEDKKETKEEVIAPLFTKDVKAKKGCGALVVLFALGVIISLVSMYNWAGAIGKPSSIFDTWYTKITDVKLNGYPIFANILGSIKAFGYWTNIDFAMLLIILIIVIGLVYRLKFSEIFEGAVAGMKEILPAAFVAVFANILLLAVNSVAEPFIMTIFDKINQIPDKVTPLKVGLTSAVGSVAYSEFPYMVNSTYPVVANSSATPKEIAYIMQVIYGFIMLVVPTSVGLVVGLQYLGISFKEWFKENWKLLLCLLAASIILITIVCMV